MQSEPSFPELTLLSDHKKELTILRLDIQKMSYQLEAEKEINRQLSSSNSSLQVKLGESYKKCVSLQEKLNFMSENYQVQVEELKVLIQTRSEELEQLSRQILPKIDQDMLRIRLINQLEIPHRQQMEDIQKEVTRLQTNLTQSQRATEILQAKLDYLEQVKQQQLVSIRSEYTDSLVGYRTEVETITQQNVRGVQSIKKLMKEVQDLKRKQVSLRQKHMIQVQGLRKENNSVLMNYGSDQQLRNLRFDLSQKAREIREEKDEAGRLKRLLDSKKEEYLRLEYDHNSLRQENQSLKDINDNYHRTNMELKLELDGMQGHEVEVRSLKKEIGMRHDQYNILVDKIRMLQQAKNVRVYPKEEVARDRGTEYELEQRIAKLQGDLRSRQEQIQGMLGQTQVRRKEPNRQRSPDRGLREKLKEANGKIVDLLREKVVLKQQLVQFQRR